MTRIAIAGNLFNLLLNKNKAHIQNIVNKRVNILKFLKVNTTIFQGFVNAFELEETKKA